MSYAIITDIEGTTSSIDHVRNVLIAHANRHLGEFIIKNWDSVKVQEAVKLLQEQLFLDENEDLHGLPPTYSEGNEEYKHTIVSYAKKQLEIKRNTKALKFIQGLALESALKNKEITGHIYEDVPFALKEWCSEQKQVFTFSTGYTGAQTALFANNNVEDVAHYFKAFYDTSIGSKLDPDSYRYICEQAGRKPHEVLFFSDRPKEIYAAKKCGLKTILVERSSEISMVKEEADFLGYEDGRIVSFGDVMKGLGDEVTASPLLSLLGLLYHNLPDLEPTKDISMKAFNVEYSLSEKNEIATGRKERERNTQWKPRNDSNSEKY